MRKSFQTWWAVVAVTLFWSIVWALNFAHRIPASAPACVRYAGAHTDFDALYAASLVVNEGIWGSLYPPAIATATDPTLAKPDEVLAPLLQTNGVPYRAAWLYPPPAALLCWPLATTTFESAQAIWIVLNGFALVWLMVLIRLECLRYKIAAIWTNAAILLGGCSVPVGAVFNTQNLSLWFAVGSILVLRGLRSETIAGPVFGLILQGVTKGFSSVWVPLLFIWRKWRIVGWSIVVTTLLLAGCFLSGCRFPVFIRFFTEIVPLAKSPDFIRGDGFPAILQIVFGTRPPNWAISSLSILLMLLLLILYIDAFFRKRRNNLSKTDTEDANALSLFLSYLLFQSFANVCWFFYRVHLLAFLPLCLHLCSAPNRRTRLVPLFLVAACLVWTPDFIWEHFSAIIHVPFNPSSWTCAVGYLVLIAFGFIAIPRGQAPFPKTSPEARDSAI